MKLLKVLWVLSNNHLNALESLPICFLLASRQLGFACYIISNSGHPACHHAQHQAYLDEECIMGWG